MTAVVKAKLSKFVPAPVGAAKVTAVVYREIHGQRVPVKICTPGPVRWQPRHDAKGNGTHARADIYGGRVMGRRHQT